MSKTIVLLSDGTGNAASSPHKTNVWRLYQALDTTPASEQIAFYDDGVGTSSFLPTRLLGLALGVGLRKNVLELYESLCRVYEPDDQIAIFGFSRGAFSARVLAELIASQGVIESNSDSRILRKNIKQAYRRFRLENFNRAYYERFHTFITNPFCKTKDDYDTLGKEARSPRITILGVWDTVDAYGAPMDEIRRAWDRVVWALSPGDRNLNKKVDAAYQALAIDEKRETFNPLLCVCGGAKLVHGSGGIVLSRAA